MKLEWNSCFKLGVSLFLLYLCISFWPAAMEVMGLLVGAASPLLIGCVIAYLVNILMSCYERYYFTDSRSPVVERSRRPVCMIGAFLSLIAVVILIVCLILPQLWSCVEVITAGIPGVLQDIIAFIEDTQLLPEDMVDSLAGIDWPSKINQIIQIITSGVGNVVDVVIKAVTSVFSWIVSALMSTIFAIYVLSGKETLARQFKKLGCRYLKEETNRTAQYVLSVVNDCFHKYIVGQCTEAVIIGVLCALGMMLLKLPYAAMVGALVAFTALIPVAGAYIGAAVGAFMILTIDPMKAVIFLIFIVVLQQVEGNIIYPKVVGSSLGLPGIWVLSAVTVGGGVMGVVGMLLSVPLVATLYRLIRNDVNGVRPAEWTEEAENVPRMEDAEPDTESE